MATKQEKMEAFGQLLDILDELRVKCPWDRKQTNESLRTNTIEETYELCDAIMKDDNNNIKKELGDLLLHIVFYAKIGEEKAAFDIKDVCDSLCQKLIYRHPHVFGNAQAETAGKVEQSWEQLKLKEKRRQQDSSRRCPHFTSFRSQSSPHPGQSPQRGFRLGTTRPGLG